ncbi:hypothetical protein SNOG_16251 [Parastagonospora nodorum SN15]|uniref:Uncharacterized protein n=1 Tax=Phaeosphaeria nodorum (strain SN15 / ATCC MYA-4574 / FGSC 10173) TaxID=321614 RepID=Q0TWD4_PHANO|nr:hypothetical protein SNOG_16251 [Parastagonospora nodorum SN15]EAT76435.1 hypothetical protein SNOG_16251 [Parastagonospora nodorum SN15]
MSIIFIMGAILMVSLLLLVLPTSALERQEPAAGWLDLQKVFLAARSSLQARNSVALDPLFKT